MLDGIAELSGFTYDTIVNNSICHLWFNFSAWCCVCVCLQQWYKPAIWIYGSWLVFLWWISCLSLYFKTCTFYVINPCHCTLYEGIIFICTKVLALMWIQFITTKHGPVIKYKLIIKRMKYYSPFYWHPVPCPVFQILRTEEIGMFWRTKAITNSSYH